MNLALDATLSAVYTSRTQVARVLTEDWFERSMYCVACAASRLRRLANNTRASDFTCPACGAAFELKSSKRRFGPTVADGAYDTMMERLTRPDAPHLAMMHYGPESVRSLFIIPAPFFTHDIIAKRRPLAPTARRAGWVGCNIRLADVPASVRIGVVDNGTAVPVNHVRDAWRRAAPLRAGDLTGRTWTIDVLRCVERLGRADFSLTEVYASEPDLQARHPGNRNVRPKIRQQLQVLRDAGWLTFLGDGRYRLTPPIAPLVPSEPPPPRR